MKISDFLHDWKEIRGKAYEFLEKIPENKMMWSPHNDLGSIGMQIRHMGVSQRAYINGIRSGTINFNDKTYNKEVEKNKAEAIKLYGKVPETPLITAKRFSIILYKVQLEFLDLGG